MEATAKLRKIPVSARKTRKIINIIRAKPIMEAIDSLKHLPHKTVPHIIKLLHSAAANLQEKNKDQKLLKTGIYIKEIYADSGRVLKRIQPRAQGRACQIRKQTCHITVKVAMQQENTPTAGTKQPSETPPPTTQKKETTPPKKNDTITGQSTDEPKTQQKGSTSVKPQKNTAEANTAAAEAKKTTAAELKETTAAEAKETSSKPQSREASPSGEKPEKPV